MPEYITPGVYINEDVLFTPSITVAATTITAFVGYTERHELAGQSFLNTPKRITSLREFELYFGGDAKHQFEINPAKRGQVADVSLGNQGYCLSQVSANFLLFRSVRLFFNNGGAVCYVVSVGDYRSGIDSVSILAGLTALNDESDSSVIAIPDAVALSHAKECALVQQKLLTQCSQGTHKRFAILDIFHGYSDASTAQQNDCVDVFRNNIAGPDFSYAAAYYPWVNTSVIASNDLGLGFFKDIPNLKKLLSLELAQSYPRPNRQTLAKVKQIQTLIDAITEENFAKLSQKQINHQQQVHQSLLSVSPLYVAIIKLMTEKINVLPPSAAICGSFAMVDNSQGVWKAPANIALSSVISPCQTLNNEQQQALNVDPSGKSINAIRSFIGKGVMIWGARTLAGNDNEWRYINVRRTAMMIEESVQNGLKAVVFEPNNEPLWSATKLMIENFLMQLWKQGALAGAKPDEAYFVNVGLNKSMTNTDILEGRLIVQLGFAMLRPAEFIILKVEQKMTAA